MMKFRTVTEGNIQSVVEEMQSFQRAYSMKEFKTEDGQVAALSLEAETEKPILDFRFSTADHASPEADYNNEGWEGYKMFRTELANGNIRYFIEFSAALSEAYSEI